MATSGTPKNRRLFLLYVRDRLAGHRFLVDSGAGISIFPKAALHSNCRIDRKPCGFRLVAANNSPISQTGFAKLHVDIGIVKDNYSFVVADVAQPILGADFIAAHDLLIDLKARRLVSKRTGEFVSGMSPSRLHSRRRLSSPC